MAHISRHNVITAAEVADYKKTFGLMYQSLSRQGYFQFISGLSFALIHTPKRKKPLLMVQNHAFTQTTTDNRYWHCFKKQSTRCPAKIRFDERGNLAFFDRNHNHEPPQYHKTQDGKFLIFLPLLIVAEVNYKLINSGRSQLLMIDGYTFSKANKISRTWHCSSSGMMNCKAHVRIDRSNTLVCVLLEHNHPPPKYIVTKDGQYCKSNRACNVWKCSSRLTSCCEAKINIDKAGRLLYHQLAHNHPPPRYHLSVWFQGITRIRIHPVLFFLPGHVEFKFIHSVRGGQLAMVQNYTFSRSNKNSIVWACSSRHASRCEAKVKIDKDGTLVYHLLTHNHPPPKYHVTNTGDYIKIS
ncbi:hypothetical protein ABMA28_001414 [Loxostege sticticalis]|uniref:FLYWCH-type domain-containing protein n=1 Tax=Loxostege sticticalis TaxID=481309 RepID=A0ABD0T1V9_LOXSC